MFGEELPGEVLSDPACNREPFLLRLCSQGLPQAPRLSPLTLVEVEDSMIHPLVTGFSKLERRLDYWRVLTASRTLLMSALSRRRV